MKKLFLLLSVTGLSVSNLLCQTSQFSAGPFPWNEEPTGVSFPNSMVFTPDKEYDLGGDWYFSDSEEGWLTLEKAFTSSENGNYESWVLATVSDNSVEFFINDIYGSIQRKYVYSGPKLSELTLEDHYEWKIGPSGYNDWVPTPPPFPVSQSLNLGSSMTGQEYVNSFLPTADFSYIEPTSSVIIKNAQELSIGLKFEDGEWVIE